MSTDSCEPIRTPLSRPPPTKIAARRLSHVSHIDDTRIHAAHINRTCNFHTVHTHSHSVDHTFQNTTRNKQSVSKRASGSNTILPHPRPRVRTSRKRKKTFLNIVENLQTITTDGHQRHVLLLRREERRCAKTNSQRMTRTPRQIQLTAPERVFWTSQQNARKHHTVLHHNGTYPAFGIGPARWPSSPSPSEAACRIPKQNKSLIVALPNNPHNQWFQPLSDSSQWRRCGSRWRQ